MRPDRPQGVTPEALRHVWIWHLRPDVFARVELAGGAVLARPANNQVEIVPGELPGTVHVTVNGVTVSEIETEPHRVDEFIDFLRSHTQDRDQT